jgi:hypothetical protein
MKTILPVFVTIAFLAGCAPVSCSHTAAIADSAARISTAAVDIEKRSEFIAESAASPSPDLPAIVHNASSIASAARSIQSEANAVTHHVASVTDKQSELLRVLWWIAVAAVIISIVVLAWRFGLDRLVYRIVALLPIPTKTRSMAELDAQVLDENKPEELREAIAARRASDPLYDAEFRAAQARARRENP